MQKEHKILMGYVKGFEDGFLQNFNPPVEEI